MKRLLVAVLLSAGSFAEVMQAQNCGGTDRWAIKMGADLDAIQVDLQNPVTTTLHDLVSLSRPSGLADATPRTASERKVRVVEGRLMQFKKESDKKGDFDFHLVISDATGLFTSGGASSPVSPHSFIAEIPDPDCVAGRSGTGPTPSRFETQLADVRSKLVQQFPNIKAHGWNPAAGVPVRLTGVVFFDLPHGQTGRALNGLELHPLLDIEFNPGTAPGLIAATAVGLQNPGFEDGAQGWTTTPDVISTSSLQPAHEGTGKAWLGGTGEAHTDRISQQITLPAPATAISLNFFLHIDTEETNLDPFDKLFVRIRDANGTLLKRLATYSNQQAGEGFTLRTFDLSAYKGRTIRIELEAREDQGSTTSFVVDSFSLIVEVP